MGARRSCWLVRFCLLTLSGVSGDGHGNFYSLFARQMFGCRMPGGRGAANTISHVRLRRLQI